MNFKLYDYVDAQERNLFAQWTQGLEKSQRAKLNARLDLLQQQGDGLLPEMLTGSPTPGILKLRCRGNVQLRPLLCKGPIDVDQEYTLLIGAIERSGKFDPAKADQTAAERKNAVLAAPNRRRCPHERIA